MRARGLVLNAAYVKPPYTYKRGGQRPRIFAILGFSLPQITEAQRRYAKYSDEEEKRKRRLSYADDEERRVEEIRLKAHVSKVIAILVEPPDPDNLSKLYSAIREAGIPDADQVNVRKRVLDWIYSNQIKIEAEGETELQSEGTFSMNTSSAFKRSSV